MKNKIKQQQQQQHQYQYRGDAPQAAIMPTTKHDAKPEGVTTAGAAATVTAVTNQETNESTAQIAAKGGSLWSPKEEIQSGNVAKFQQMLWGGGGAGGAGGGKKSAEQQPQPPSQQHAVASAGAVTGTGKGGNGIGGKGGTMSPHVLPPATPPRHPTLPFTYTVLTACSASSASITAAPGSFSLGLRIIVLPAVVANGNIHRGTIAGKLKGQIPATTCIRGIRGDNIRIIPLASVPTLVH